MRSTKGWARTKIGPAVLAAGLLLGTAGAAVAVAVPASAATASCGPNMSFNGCH